MGISYAIVLLLYRLVSMLSILSVSTQLTFINALYSATSSGVVGGPLVHVGITIGVSSSAALKIRGES